MGYSVYPAPSAATAPATPAGYSIADGGTLGAGYYALSTLNPGTYIAATGGTSRNLCLARMVSGDYKYYFPNTGYSTNNWTTLNITSSTGTGWAAFSKFADQPSTYYFVKKIGSAWFTCDAFTTSGLWRSTDGTNWTKVINTSSAFVNVEYDGTTYVAVASSDYSGSGLYYSSDGISWTAVTAFPANYSAGNTYSLTYGNGTFVFCGYNTASSEYRLAYSTNGSTWTALSSPAGNSSQPWRLMHNGLTSASSKFLAWNSGNTTLYSSVNGTTWSSISLPATSGVNSTMHYGNGLWCYVPSEGSTSYYTSPDGATWTARAPYTQGTIYYPSGSGTTTSANPELVSGIFYANGAWYGFFYGSVGEYGVIATTTTPTNEGSWAVVAPAPRSGPSGGTITAAGAGMSGAFIYDGTNYWFASNRSSRFHKTSNFTTNGRESGRFQLYSDAYRNLN